MQVRFPVPAQINFRVLDLLLDCGELTIRCNPYVVNGAEGVGHIERKGLSG